METVRVTPGMLPPTISTTPNSPMVWAKLSAVPVTRPDIESGRMMWKNVRRRDAPRVADAASKRRSTVPKWAARAQRDQQIKTEHGGGQNDGERDDGFDEKLPAPARVGDPVGDGQSDNDENHR